jgi:hypothetical protein
VRDNRDDGYLEVVFVALVVAKGDERRGRTREGEEGEREVKEDLGS